MRIYITRKIPAPGIELLRRKHIEFDIWDSDEPIPHDVLVEKMKNNYDGLYCMLTDTIDSEVLEAAGTYKNVFKYYSFSFTRLFSSLNYLCLPVDYQIICYGYARLNTHIIEWLI